MQVVVSIRPPQVSRDDVVCLPTPTDRGVPLAACEPELTHLSVTSRDAATDGAPVAGERCGAAGHRMPSLEAMRVELMPAGRIGTYASVVPHRSNSSWVTSICAK